MFDSELLQRFEYLALAANRAGGRSLLAAPRERIPGGGTEVTGVRDYAPGDEYRYINWTWCARRDELLTKVFEGDADLHYYVLLDCSPSMGQGRPSKFDLARLVTAALGYLAATKLDRLSVVAFCEGIVAESPPLRHLARMPRLLRFLQELPLRGTRTDLGKTAETFVRRYQRHGPTVVISDLYDRDGFCRALDILRYHGYEPRLVQIDAPSDADPQLLGDMELADVEAGGVRRVTITERAARRYRELFAAFRQSVRRYCSRYSVDYMPVACDTPRDDVLMAVLGRRSQMTGV